MTVVSVESAVTDLFRWLLREQLANLLSHKRNFERYIEVSADTSTLITTIHVDTHIAVIHVLTTTLFDLYLHWIRVHASILVLARGLRSQVDTPMILLLLIQVALVTLRNSGTVPSRSHINRLTKRKTAAAYSLTQAVRRMLTHVRAATRTGNGRLASGRCVNRLQNNEARY